PPDLDAFTLADRPHPGPRPVVFRAARGASALRRILRRPAHHDGYRALWQGIRRQLAADLRAGPASRADAGPGALSDLRMAVDATIGEARRTPVADQPGSPKRTQAAHHRGAREERAGALDRNRQRPARLHRAQHAVAPRRRG